MRRAPRSPRAICRDLVAARRCGGGGDGGGEPDSGGGRREAPGARAARATTSRPPTELGFPAFATRNTTRVGGADPIADAAAVAQAVFPSRDDDTRPRAVTLVDATDWRVAVSAAQLMAPAAAGADPVLRRRRAAGRDRAGARPARSRPAPRRPAARRSSASATPPSPRATRRRAVEGADHAALAQAIDRLQHRGRRQAGAGGHRRVVASSPGFSMPAAGWAAKSGDPVLWVTRDAIPAATRAAITAHKRPRIYVLGPESAVSKKRARPARRARRGAPDRRRRPGRQRDRVRALLGRLVRLERRRPGARARVRDHPAPARRRRRRAAVGVGHLRAAAARHRGERAAGAAAGLPARHPARLRPGPRARRLQPRLADRRRGGDLRRRPGPHRLAAGDPARRPRDGA